MRPDSQDLEALIARVRGGCPEAARLLVERYSEPLRRVIRCHLHRRLRPAFDSGDFLQSVWKDFFRRPVHEQTFLSAEGLLAFLYRMGRNKLREAHRNHLDTRKRCRGREVGLPADVPERRPPPDRAVEAEDEWRRLLRRFPPRWHEALQMLREGHSHPEVAERLGVTERALGRLLERARGQAAGAS